MSTFNGIGTKFYGATDHGSDGSYITTNWFVFFYLPIIPLESFRVIEEGSTNYLIYNSQEYRALKVELHKRQIVKTYAWTYGIIGLIAAISLFTNSSPQEKQQATLIKQQTSEQELDTVSRLVTRNIFLNNSSYYNKEELARIKTSQIYDNNFQLFWRAYFIYFLEDLDSTLITKTKYIGQKRNEIESKMLGNIVTQDDLDVLNKIQNDIAYNHKVTIQNKTYTDKEYIDSLISWHFYKNAEKDYGLKIFKE